MKTPPRFTLCLIPGGPGLGVASLGSCAVLNQDFDTVLLEPLAGSVSFAQVVEDLELQIERLGRSVILVGHSFGSLYSTALVARGRVPVQGWVGMCMCTTAKGWGVFEARALSLRTPERMVAQTAFYSNPTDLNFRSWLKSLAAIYFHSANRERGAEMFDSIPVSAQAFLSVLQSMGPNVFFEGTEKLLAFKGTKVLIAGGDDAFFPAEELESEAEAVGADLVTISGAHHFVTIDNEAAVAKALTTHFASF
jgi:pimeloyl-ACP methyl ester carboxylesterase